MRLWFAAIMLCALGIGRASAEDNGEELFENFAKTCATKPVSGAELDARARGLGYISQNGANDPDDGKRDLDFLYFWKLPNKHTNFAINAYFFGPRAHYQVNCSIRSDNVDFNAFVGTLERNTSLPPPQMTSDPKTGAPIYTWTVDSDGANDILQVEAFGEDRRRADVRLTYEVIAR
jgi:hypothetical protein